MLNYLSATRHPWASLVFLLPWVVVPVALAFRHFGRKDILS